MKESEIIHLIQENPRFSYEQLKQQAVQAGITPEEFESAWKKANRKHIIRNIFLGLISLIFIGFLTYSAFKYLSPAFSKFQFNLGDTVVEVLGILVFVAGALAIGKIAGPFLNPRWQRVLGGPMLDWSRLQFTGAVIIHLIIYGIIALMFGLWYIIGFDPRCSKVLEWIPGERDIYDTLDTDRDIWKCPRDRKIKISDPEFQKLNEDYLRLIDQMLMESNK